MELSAELFEQTIRLFKGDGSAIKNQRRTHPRVGIRCHIKIVPIENGAIGSEIEVWTRDVSRTGIGIICSQKMKCGDRFVVRFPREGAAKPLALVCTIKCCSQLSKGIFAIGAVFEGIGLDKLEHPASAAAPAPTETPAPAKTTAETPAPTPAVPTPTAA